MVFWRDAAPCTWSFHELDYPVPSIWRTKCVGLLMSGGFLHSNGGGCPASVRLTARSDRPALPSSLLLLATTPWLPPTALQLTGSTSPKPAKPAPVICSTWSTASSTRSTSNRPRTHALINFETRQICSTASSQHRLIITSVSAAPALFLDRVARPLEANLETEKTRSWTPDSAPTR